MRNMKTQRTARNYFHILIGLALIGLLGITTIGIAKMDTWTRKTDMPTARWSLSTSAVNGKIYAIGGWPGGSNLSYALATVEEYAQKTDTWTKKADMPTARGGLSTSVVEGKIYAIGGWPGGGNLRYALSTVEEYAPKTDTWTKKADMPTARADFSTSTVNGKIYAIGGRTAGGITVSSVEEYNPKTDTWTKKSDMPSARAALSTSTVNGKIYAIGGTKVFSVVPAFSPVEEYDPVTDTWTEKTDMPTARAGLSTIGMNGKIYAIGGTAGPWSPGISSVEEYAPMTNKWIKKAEMPTARGYFSTSLANGKIYAIGGSTKCSYSCISIALSTIEEYDIGFVSRSRVSWR